MTESMFGEVMKFLWHAKEAIFALAVSLVAAAIIGSQVGELGLTAAGVVSQINAAVGDLREASDTLAKTSTTARERVLWRPFKS